MNRSSRSLSLLRGDDLEAPHAVGGWPASSGSMRPRSTISLNSSTRLSAWPGRSSGPTCSSSARWPFGHVARRSARGRRLRRGGRSGRARRRRLAGRQSAEAGQQLVRVDRVAAAALVERQLRLERIAGAQQHIDHRGGRLELVATQLVEQRFHLVRQFGHVGEAEGGGAALDRVRAAEDRVQLLVVGRLDVDLEQLLLHAPRGSRRPPRRRPDGTGSGRCRRWRSRCLS